jgi:predicted RNase H-like HicB family nuclease
VLHIELDREEDGRYIAEVVELPGVLAYGDTQEAAATSAAGLAISVIANRIEHGEPPFPENAGDPLPFRSIFEIKSLP